MLGSLQNLLNQVDPIPNDSYYEGPSPSVAQGAEQRVLCFQPNPQQAATSSSFSDSAPSWEALQQLVEEKGLQLKWQQPDLENVRAELHWN